MQVILYNDNYLEQLVDFYRTVWNKHLAVDLFIKQRKSNLEENPYAKEGGFRTVIIVDNGKVVGHETATPCRLWDQKEERLMHWFSGLNLLPEARGKGLATLVREKLTNNCLPIVTGFSVIGPAVTVFRKGGWTVAGKIPEYIKVVNPKNFVRKLDISKLENMPNILTSLSKQINIVRRTPIAIAGSFLIKCYNGYWKLLTIKDRNNRLIKIVRDFDFRIDELWGKIKSALKIAQVRKAAYLNWHFKSQEGWTKVVYEVNSDVLGYAVVSVRHFSQEGRLPNMKVVSIIDILWDFTKPNVFHGLLHYIEKFAHKQGADVVLCSISIKKARRLLIKNAFIRIPSTVTFAFHCSDKNIRLSPKLDGWFITRGDADAAGSLGPDRPR